MKKILLCILLCAFALPIIAQEQEDVIVRRGTYQPKPKKERTGDWYNEFSASIAIHDQLVYSGFYGNMYLEGIPVSIGYKLLKQLGIFYFGPGLHLVYDDWHDMLGASCFGLNVFAHGRIELSGTSNILGFERVFPSMGLSLGMEYMDSPKIYFDYSLGISIKCGNHSFLGISYFAEIHDCANRLNEIYTYKLCHGAELSFRF